MKQSAVAAVCDRRTSERRRSQTAATVLLVALSMFCANARATEVAAPLLPSAPVVDGTINTREWGCAAQVGPLVRATDGLAEKQTTAIFVGWRDNSLFVALRQSFPESRVATESTATSASALQRGDHVAVGVGESRVVLWPGQAFLVGRKVDWECKSRLTKDGWEAELRLPVEGQPVTLTVERAELTVDPITHRLTAELNLGKIPLAVRMVEAGEFSQGRYQGVAFELVNFGNEPRQVIWADQTLTLAPNSRRAIRQATPVSMGVQEVQYAIRVGDTNLARGKFAFAAGGPIKVGILPIHLWREGVYVRTRLEDERPAELSVQLLTPSGKPIGPASRFSAPQQSVTEQFISLKAIKPGGYAIAVEAREGDKVIARHILRSIKPTPPDWWEGASASLREPQSRTLAKLGGREIYKQPIEYPVGGHFDPREGTIEFWMRFEAPAEDGGKNQFPIFFVENPFETTQRLRLIYQTVFSANQYVFYVASNGRMMDQEVGGPYIVTVEETQTALTKADVGSEGRYPRTPRLKPNEWHHVAMTWKDYPVPTIALYLDGKLIIRPIALPATTFFDLEACTLQLLGAHYHDNITFDELRVSNVARTAGEIAATAVGSSPVAADIYTTLLDRFEQLTETGKDSHTVAEVTSRPDYSPGGRLQPSRAGVVQVDGKFGKGLKTLKY